MNESFTAEDFARANLAAAETRAALRRELRDAQAPLSLDVLAAAWGAAEVPTEDTPIREGDVLIYPLFAGYCVRPSWGDSPLPEARVLSRAPRQPWADLADMLQSESVVFGSEDAGIAAQALHNAGVRVTGGEES